MKIWRSLDQVPPGLPCPVVTIGNFDGVHAGHRRILEAARDQAASTGGAVVVLTFDPHPTRIIAPERAPRLLTPLPMKIEQLRNCGVNAVLVLPFTVELSRLSPEEFVRQVVVGRLGARRVVVGENFRFGHKQAGDVRGLEELGREIGFRVSTLGAVKVRGEVVSSSRIRKLLEEGRLSLANRLLGRCFSIRGRIVKGQGVGRRQTVPTLNLEDYAESLPARGVYITETSCDGGRSRSVTNIGYRPTFEEARNAPVVESFVLQGPPPPASEMDVIFWRRLRDEKKFPSAEALKAQIQRDVKATESFFRRLGNKSEPRT